MIKKDKKKLRRKYLDFIFFGKKDIGNDSGEFIHIMIRKKK